MAVSAPLFHLTGIRYAYALDHPVLDDARLCLEAGERLALLGANGSGKTTLLHLMVGLIKPQAGEIHAFGKTRQSEADFWEVRARAGLLFQDPDDQLFCPTVAEDVAFGPLNLGKNRAQVHRIVHDTLAFLGLDGFGQRITHKLSGGEKRLVSLATVLAMEPDVLLLDEPSNALDNESRERLLTILQKLPQSMVLISHDRDFVERLATRRVYLNAGKLSSA
ncbi:MAG: ABC transporter ATP-binding protein [Gammaproteobacteria bacterium]|nr:ABC transporter ATP-binding protein [Gammaproteobacteria bacterium]